MTLEEANKLVSDLAMGLIPSEHRWQGTGGTLKVRGGWVRLGEAGIRSALVETLINWLPGGMPSEVGGIRVLVGNDWYYLDTKETEPNE